MDERRSCVYVGVGSNIAPEKNIVLALDALRRATTVTGLSTFYWSTALERPAQPRFLNGVVRIETSVAPRHLKFDVLRRIEQDLARVRTDDRHAARTIDLDILLYGREIVSEPDLIIPDPDIALRPFLAVPLLDLDPGLILPGTATRLSSQITPGASSGLEPAPAFTERLRTRCVA